MLMNGPGQSRFNGNKERFLQRWHEEAKQGPDALYKAIHKSNVEGNKTVPRTSKNGTPEERGLVVRDRAGSPVGE